MSSSFLGKIKHIHIQERLLLFFKTDAFRSIYHSNITQRVLTSQSLLFHVWMLLSHVMHDIVATAISMAGRVELSLVVSLLTSRRFLWDSVNIEQYDTFLPEVFTILQFMSWCLNKNISEDTLKKCHDHRAHPSISSKRRRADQHTMTKTPHNEPLTHEQRITATQETPWNHIKNTPIQMCWNFHHQKQKVFR